MKTRLVIGVLLATLFCPPVSHGFGLLRYIFDGLSNQFGFDRGPIPKTVDQYPHANFNPQAPYQPGQKPHPDAHRIHIQAEGF
jgi:hypothetical protein